MRPHLSRRLAFAALCAVVAACGCDGGDASREPGERDAAGADAATRSVFVFAARGGPSHEATREALEAVAAAARDAGLEATSSREAGELREAVLRKHAALVLVHTSGAELDARARHEVERFHEAGGGLGFVHLELGAEHDWGWLQSLLGTRRNQHGPRRARTLHSPATATETEVTGATDPAAATPPTRIETTIETRLETRIEDGWHETAGRMPPSGVARLVDERGAPVSWRDPERRTFWTDLGHSPQSLALPALRAHLATELDALSTHPPIDFGRAKPALHAWKQERWPAALAEPIAFALLPDGAAFVTERRGTLVRIDAAATRSTVVARFPVAAGDEVGLLGIALDPSFAETGWLYLFRTRPGDGAPVHRISRFTYDAARGVLDIASEVAVIEVPAEPDTVPHRGGALACDAQGLLYIGLGDESYTGSAGFGALGGRGGRALYDASRTAGDASDLRGSVLRVRPLAEGGYAIPAGNLFPVRGAAEPSDVGPGRPEIYAMGARNPFSLALDPREDALFWGDVGPDAAKARPDAGPAGADEINWSPAAGNFGWPFFIGANGAYRGLDPRTGQPSPPFDPRAPVNLSPHNRGARTLPAAQPAWLSYGQRATLEFFSLGEGPRSIIVGDVAGPRAPTRGAGALPARYDGALLIGDYMRGWIQAIHRAPDGAVAQVERIAPGLEFAGIVALHANPAGALHVLEYGTRWYEASPQARLSRIVFDPAAPAPAGTPEAMDRRAPARTAPDRPAALVSFGPTNSRSFYFDEGGAAPTLDYAAPRAGLALVYDPSPAPVAAAREALREEGCTGCHAWEASPTQSAAAPSFAAIAGRYAAEVHPVPALAAKVRAGGAGSWGIRAMPPQRNISTSRLQAMVAALLRTQAEAREVARDLPARGRVTFDAHRAQSVDFGAGPFYRGTYRFEPAPPHAAGEPTGIRHHRLLATDHDASAGLGDGKFAVAYRGTLSVTPEAEGAWIRFDALDLRDRRSAALHLSPQLASAGAAIELRGDAPDGPLLGDRIVIQRHDGSLTTYEVDLREPAPDGLRDIYVVFRRGASDEFPSLLGLTLAPAAASAADRPPR